MTSRVLHLLSCADTHCLAYEGRIYRSRTFPCRAPVQLVLNCKWKNKEWLINSIWRFRTFVNHNHYEMNHWSHVAVFHENILLATKEYNKHVQSYKYDISDLICNVMKIFYNEWLMIILQNVIRCKYDLENRFILV